MFFFFYECNTDFVSEVNVIPGCVAFDLHQCVEIRPLIKADLAACEWNRYRTAINTMTDGYLQQ